MTQFDQPTQAMELQDHELLNRFVFKDREELEQKFGMELERIIELYQSDKGRMELLEKMKEEGVHDENVDAALQIVSQNAEQLQKKESFMKKMLMLPVRGFKAVGRTMRKHPVLTAVAGVAALIALLYFMPAPPGVGALRDSMIEGGKKILEKIGVGLPEAATDAIGEIPVTSGPVGSEVLDAGAEIISTPENVFEQIDRLDEILPVQ